MGDLIPESGVGQYGVAALGKRMNLIDRVGRGAGVGGRREKGFGVVVVLEEKETHRSSRRLPTRSNKPRLEVCVNVRRLSAYCVRMRIWARCVWRSVSFCA